MMWRRGLVRGAVLMLAGGAALASSPAWALFGGSGGKCDRTDNDRQEASRVIRNIAGRLDAMETTIVETLRKHAGQVSGYQARSAKAIVEAIGNHSKLRAQTQREVEENRAVRDRRPTRRGCRTATGARGMAAARAAVAREKAKAAAAGVGRIASDRSVAQGSSADNSQRFEAVMARYCNRGKLGEDAVACKGAPGSHAADLDPRNLFDRNRLVSEQDRRTAIEVSRNLAVPVVYDQFPLSAAETSQERRRVLLARSADARAALAADFFSHARALRAPGPDLGRWAAALVPGRDPDQPVSRYELIEILAARRFENPDWLVQLQAMNEANLLREVVTLLATSLLLDWERYRMDERRGALDAVSAAIGAEGMRRLPGLAEPASGVN